MHSCVFHNCTDNSHISTTACSVGHCVYIIAVREMYFQDLQNFLDEVEEGVIYFSALVAVCVVTICQKRSGVCLLKPSLNCHRKLRGNWSRKFCLDGYQM